MLVCTIYLIFTNWNMLLWIELTLCFFALLWILHFQRKKTLPPGPYSIPILGTVELFQGEKQNKGFFKDKYNEFQDFCTFFLGPKQVLILINNFKIVKELFSKDEFSGNIII